MSELTRECIEFLRTALKGLEDGYGKVLDDETNALCDMALRTAEAESHAEYEQQRADGAVAELVEVHAKLAEAEKDAARYRWLRDKSTPENGMFYLASASTQARFLDPAFVDDHIDAALSPPKGDAKPGYMGDVNGPGCDPDVP